MLEKPRQYFTKPLSLDTVHRYIKKCNLKPLLHKEETWDKHQFCAETLLSTPCSSSQQVNQNNENIFYLANPPYSLFPGKLDIVPKTLPKSGISTIYLCKIIIEKKQLSNISLKFPVLVGPCCLICSDYIIWLNLQLEQRDEHTNNKQLILHGPCLVSRFSLGYVGLRQVQTQLADCSGLSSRPLH